tara:strand:- start:90 stop:320 length:231 start_codon:yes stop_codon:yes gene_type:complete
MGRWRGRSDGHFHRYGPWKLLRSPVSPKTELSDEDYIASLRLEPMWEQECDCGFKNIVRKSSKPNAKFKFNDHWRR